eukprot:1088544-Rhodomonas_salina.3
MVQAYLHQKVLTGLNCSSLLTLKSVNKLELSYGGHFLGHLLSYDTTVGFRPFGNCPSADGSDGRMCPSTAGRLEKHRIWKAAERELKKMLRQQTNACSLPFPERKQCGTMHCDGNGTLGVSCMRLSAN